MDYKSASTPGNVDTSKIEQIVGWLHLNFSKAKQKNICKQIVLKLVYVWSSLSTGKLLEVRSIRC